MEKKRKKRNWFKRSTRVVGMDPITFEEWWRVKINRIQLLSIIILFSILLFIFNYLIFSYTPIGHILPENIKNRNKQKIEEAALRVADLNRKIDVQEAYISNLQKVILGEVSIDSLYSVSENMTNDMTQEIKVDTSITLEEKELAKHIKESAERNVAAKSPIARQLFLFDPIVGVISKGFSLPNHPAVDIVAEKDAQIKACLEGIVLHASYNDNDGHTIIIRHANDIISIYKHTKTVYVKAGTQVKTGQSIGVVGNSGEQSTGPHLHFELWSDVGPLDPMN
ncbi:MAG TPA: M23 family metallopeptidase, partial [Brumimicrobium sp.]|nr:M23 family metallopeptidase [Brumimicrobium sp.]